MEKCLSTLIGSSYPTNILVIDNGSTDSTVSIIKSKFPIVQVIETGRNLGFGQANNIGFEIAIKNNADYVFLLNQDTWIEAGTLLLLIESHVKEPSFGIISPKHFAGNGLSLDRYFANYLLEFSSREELSSIVLNENLPDKVELINTQFVNAAAWLISSECLLKTGRFDPIFFHYGEDRDYAQRAIYWGFKIGIHPKAKIFHDREERILQLTDDPKTTLQREWIHFLNQACNIQKSGHEMLVIRRFLRHSFQTFLNTLALNRKEIRYNYFMARKIALTFHRIGVSRKRSMASSSTGYWN